ncbi:hypothetical protein [Desmospora activa]|uniref:Phr family secreted Rap phosphatase inhibitor n=1 Tax=Desmospora activa DSM 45169 TaxID=1121389 RepID=A0A2T4Z828_9BACL|nr:hypothetical protein [Desmospora activa]PTM58030.1 hypothetical protein C8J48_0602 [Desmospora activa DSM 45169]
MKQQSKLVAFAAVIALLFSGLWVISTSDVQAANGYYPVGENPGPGGENPRPGEENPRPF